MIFLTIGSVLPFDRLIQAMDDWVGKNTQEQVFAQIGNGTYTPQNMDYVRKLSQAEFSQKVAKADLIVAHAGMGTVIMASRVSCPIIIIPRAYRLGEVASDHQFATANWLRSKPGIFVADKETDLPKAILMARKSDRRGIEQISDTADPAFTDKIRTAILDFLG